MNDIELKTTLKNWLSEYDWTHFASLSFKNSVSLDYANRVVKEWVRKIIKGPNKLQVGYMGVLNHQPNSHLHLLMVGHNRFQQNLFSLTDNQWGQLMRDWRGSAHVRPIDDIERASGYVVDMNMPDGQHELLIPYNEKLLHRSRRANRPVIYHQCGN